jgi:ubiquinone/menaquinone biosynthesis C-methylase UbiE
MTYYDEIAKGYDELHREEQENKIGIIKQKLKVNPEDKLLDVGCGTGVATRPWRCKRFGIDPSKKLLEKAKQADLDGNYALAPAEKIPFEDNSFDIVISITAIQNFDDIEKGLKEIKRVGKGRFVLSFLKKSGKAEMIERLINHIFQNIYKRVEEEKDIIFFI